MFSLNSDLEQSLSAYSDEAKLQRLCRILDVSLPKISRLDDPALCFSEWKDRLGFAHVDVSEVARRALNLSQKLCNPRMYQLIGCHIDQLQCYGIGDTCNTFDPAVFDEMIRRVAKQKSALQRDIAKAQATQVKHTVKNSIFQAVDTLIAVGRLDMAEQLLISNGNSFSEKQANEQWLLRLMDVDCLLQNYETLKGVSSKANCLVPHASEAHKEELVPKATVVKGVLAMRGKAFHTAAVAFTSIPNDSLGKKLSHIASVEDIALWGALCVLASDQPWNRYKSDFRAETSVFREAIGCNSFTRNLLFHFDRCNFSLLVRMLKDSKASLEFDPHIGDFVGEIIDTIIRKTICRFFQGFEIVTIQTFAKFIGLHDQELFRILTHLITSGKLEARIDTVQGCIIKRRVNREATTTLKALDLADDLIEAAQSACRCSDLAECLEPEFI